MCVHNWYRPYCCYSWYWIASRCPSYSTIPSNYSDHLILCTPPFLCTLQYNFSFCAAMVPVLFYFLKYSIGHHTINKNQVKQPWIHQEKIKGEGYEFWQNINTGFRTKYRHWGAYRSVLNWLYSYNDGFLLWDYGPEISCCGTIGKTSQKPLSELWEMCPNQETVAQIWHMETSVQRSW